MKYFIFTVILVSGFSSFALSGALETQVEKVYDRFVSKTLARHDEKKQIVILSGTIRALETYQSKKQPKEPTKGIVRYLNHLFCTTLTTLDGTLCRDGYLTQDDLLSPVEEMSQSELREIFIREHSARRADRGYSELTASPKLTDIAQMYAEKLCSAGELTHELDGSTLESRLRDGGYTARYYGENIGAGQPTIGDILDQFTISPPHRANLYRPEYTHIGIGHCDDTWVVNYGDAY